MLIKKELLEFEPKKLELLKTTRYEATAGIYNGKRSGKILAAFLYKNGKLYSRLFFNGENYITYWENVGHWGSGNPFAEHHHYAGTKTDEIAREYFKKNYGSLNGLMDQKICIINRRKREKANDRKWERVRRHLDLLPKNLPDAAIETFERSVPHRGILYVQKTKTGNYRIRCCACGKVHHSKDMPKSRDMITCPKCGSRIKIAKERYIEGKSAQDKEALVFAHETKSEGTPAILLITATVIRTVTAEGRYGYQYDTDYFEVRTENRMYPYKYNQQLYSYTDARYPLTKKAFICTSCLEKYFGDSKYKGVELSRLEGVKVDFHQLLASASCGPMAGRLVQKGLVNLAEHANMLTQSEDFEEVLGISRNYMQSVKRWNISYKELRILRKADCWVDDDLFAKIQDITSSSGYFDHGRFAEMLQMMSYKKAIGYIAKQMKITRKPPGEVMGWYLDYIRMSEELLNKTYKRNDCKIEKRYMFPKDIKDAHDKVSDQLRCSNNPRKNRQIKAIYMRHHKEYAFKYKGLMAVMPKSIEDFIVEGRKLNHCIASGDGYIDKHIAREKMSFFIRKVSEPDEPYFTFSVNMETLKNTDCNGKNHKLETKEIKEFIKAFLQHLGAEKAKAA